MRDEKYVVFKREEFEKAFDGLIHERNILQAAELGDLLARFPVELNNAVVIRTHDVFAASGLYAYGWNVSTHVELLRRGLTTGPPSEQIDTTLADLIDRLDAIAHYFFDRAQEAESNVEEGRTKVPD